MSRTASVDPEPVPCATPAFELLLQSRPRRIDSFTVARVLPARERRLVGPFCFLDHLGPTQLAPGQGLDVRPHPHICLATVSYVLQGEIVHRDSLGSYQPIRPGAINWMNAGRGIVHSERTPQELRTGGSLLHSLQLWVALPLEHEESEPGFQHHPAETLPRLELGDARVRVLAGTAFGALSPVRTASPLFFAEVELPAGATLEVPAEHAERAAYVIAGQLSCGEQRVPAQSLAVLARGRSPRLHADGDTRLVLLGGAPLEGERHIEWNFVASSKARIERAKDDWRKRRFPSIPGDDQEFIPLP